MTDVTTIHQPVLLRDCVDLVAPALAKPGSIAVDCTLGLAGHSTAFLKASPNARLIGIDRDTEALALATKRMEMEGLADRFTPVHAAFDDFSKCFPTKASTRSTRCSWTSDCPACRSMRRNVASPIPMTRRSTCVWT